MSEVKNTVLKNSLLENLKEKAADASIELRNGYKSIPIHQIIEHAQYLQQSVLPRIEEKRGINSDDYKFYKGLVDSLVYALIIHDRFDGLNFRLHNASLLNEVLTGKVHFYEKELTKYTTMEDLLMGETFHSLKDSFTQRALNIVSKNNTTTV